MAEIVAERAEMYGIRQPGDVDIETLASELHVSNHTAYNILEKKVKKGELIKIKVLENGYRPNVYRKKSDTGVTS